MSESQSGPLLGREDRGEVTVLRVKVPMLRSDETTESLFGQACSVVEGEGRPRLVLNLGGVEYLASAAVGKLVTLMRTVRSAGGRLVLCKVTRAVEELLRVTHLADVLLLYDDEQEAVASFG
jgi:anti-sigma B factor antagonist